MEINIEDASTIHLPGILEIVNHAILETTAVYDYNPKSLADMELWLQEKQDNNWPVIVALQDNAVLGYATFGTFRSKEAFKYTVEHSVYINDKATGKGLGTLLLNKLIAVAKAHGHHTMIGCIDADNKGSIAFHERFGFTGCGIIKAVGFKFNRWLDMQLMQLILND